MLTFDEIKNMESRGGKLYHPVPADQIQEMFEEEEGFRPDPVKNVFLLRNYNGGSSGFETGAVSATLTFFILAPVLWVAVAAAASLLALVGAYVAYVTAGAISATLHTRRFHNAHKGYYRDGRWNPEVTMLPYNIRTAAMPLVITGRNVVLNIAKAYAKAGVDNNSSRTVIDSAVSMFSLMVVYAEFETFASTSPMFHKSATLSQLDRDVIEMIHLEEDVHKHLARTVKV